MANFNLNYNGIEQLTKSDLTGLVKSASINGGAAVIPDSNGKIDLTVEIPSLDDYYTQEEIDTKEAEFIKSISVNGETPVTPVDGLASLTIDTGGGDLTNYYTKTESDAKYVSGISINGGNVATPVNGVIDLTISSGGSSIIGAEWNGVPLNSVSNYIEFQFHLNGTELLPDSTSKIINLNCVTGIQGSSSVISPNANGIINLSTESIEVSSLTASNSFTANNNAIINGMLSSHWGTTALHPLNNGDPLVTQEIDLSTESYTGTNNYDFSFIFAENQTLSDAEVKAAMEAQRDNYIDGIRFIYNNIKNDSPYVYINPVGIVGRASATYGVFPILNHFQVNKDAFSSNMNLYLNSSIRSLTSGVLFEDIVAVLNNLDTRLTSLEN